MLREFTRSSGTLAYPDQPVCHVCHVWHEPIVRRAQ